MKKVFCKNCRYLKKTKEKYFPPIGVIYTKEAFDSLPEYINEYHCTHPNNIGKQLTENTWYESKSAIEFKDRPEALNCNNDCKWFEVIENSFKEKNGFVSFRGD